MQDIFSIGIIGGTVNLSAVASGQNRGFWEPSMIRTN